MLYSSSLEILLDIWVILDISVGLQLSSCIYCLTHTFHFTFAIQYVELWRFVMSLKNFLDIDDGIFVGNKFYVVPCNHCRVLLMLNSFLYMHD